ncbi:MAG: hypothetical protein KUG73_11440 [Pseudomonadales bacterium]|nr:hypothetical protein [Pseudomonadales bacterium]
MEHHYQVTFTKSLIADYDITFIRDVMSRYLEVDHLAFNQAFKRKNLVFNSKMNVDDAQLCLTELEAAGINTRIEKTSSIGGAEPLAKFGFRAVTELTSGSESALSGELPEPVLPKLLQSLLPNNANSAVVVFSYLIVFYQVVSFFS